MPPVERRAWSARTPNAPKYPQGSARCTTGINVKCLLRRSASRQRTVGVRSEIGAWMRVTRQRRGERSSAQRVPRDRAGDGIARGPTAAASPRPLHNLFILCGKTSAITTSGSFLMYINSRQSRYDELLAYRAPPAANGPFRVTVALCVLHRWRNEEISAGPLRLRGPSFARIAPGLQT